MPQARRAQRAETIGAVLRSIIAITIWSVAVLTALDVLGVNLAPLIAGAGIVGVALAFGAQSVVRDFLTGLFMLLEDQYGVGDVIDLGLATGTVEGVSLRTTRVRDYEGVVWHVPNGEVHRVGNKSRQWARALVDVAIAYDADLARATEVIREVARDAAQRPCARRRAARRARRARGRVDGARPRGAAGRRAHPAPGAGAGRPRAPGEDQGRARRRRHRGGTAAPDGGPRAHGARRP